MILMQLYQCYLLCCIFFGIYSVFLVIFTQVVIFIQKRKQTQALLNLLNFIVVVPVTVCKEVHGLANTVRIMI